MLRMAAVIPAILFALYLAVVFAAWSLQGRLIYPAPQTRFDPDPGYSEITLTTSDDLSIRAFARRAEEGRPTIVYFHGNGGTLGGSMASNSMFAEAGYGLLLVNYRGYGGNPGEPSEEGFYRDGRAAMDWLAGQGIAPSQVILAGNSIGSGTATQMAREYDVRALVLVAPFASLTRVASEAAPWLPVERLLRDEFDNAAKLPLLDIPILIQHGTADTLVPFAHGKTLAEANARTQLQSFEGIGHNLTFNPASQVARLEWVEQLPGG